MNDFLGAYNTVDAALDAAAAAGVYLPANVAAQVANAGLGLYGAPGTWYGAGAAQGWSAGGATGFLGGLGTAIGGAGLFLGAMNIIGNLDKIFAGGSDDRTKTGKWFGALQAETTPEGALNRINNLITTGWKGETKTDYLYVMKPLLESGIIDANYPTLWGEDSQYDIANMRWYPGGTHGSTGDNLDLKSPAVSFLTGMLGGRLSDTYEKSRDNRMVVDPDTKNKLQYGWDSANDEQWKALTGGIINRPGFAGVGDRLRNQLGILSPISKGGEYDRQAEETSPYKPDHNAVGLGILGLTNDYQLRSALGTTGALTPEQQANRDLLESYGISINVKPADDEGWHSSHIGLGVPGLKDFWENQGAGGDESLARIFDAAGMSKQAEVVNYFTSKTNGGGEEGKRIHFTNVYNTIKDSGYTGDLSKLETYLGIGA